MDFRDDTTTTVRERETVTGTPAGTTPAAPVPAAQANRVNRKVEMLVRYLTSLLLGLLGIRFILALLGANENNPFAAFIYNVTYPFVAPFFGLFGYQFQYGVARAEIETLVAMAVYALIGYAISRLLRIGRA